MSGLIVQIAGLAEDVSGIEFALDAAQSSAGIWQMYAIAALVLGAVVGYFVGPMLKK